MRARSYSDQGRLCSWKVHLHVLRFVCWPNLQKSRKSHWWGRLESFPRISQQRGRWLSSFHFLVVSSGGVCGEIWGHGVCLYLSQYSHTSGGNPSSNVGLSTKMTGANKSSEVSQVTQARSLHAPEPESRVTTTSDLRRIFVWWQWIHGGSNSLLQNNYYKKVN